jgi:uncharacterized protein (DUF362 family)
VLAGGRQVRAAPKGPKVAIVRDKAKKAIDAHRVDLAIVERLVDKAVTTLTGKDDVAKGWATCAGPKDKVAIKFNGLFRNASTHPELVYVVTNGLLRSGVDPANIVVYDRNDFSANPPRFPTWRDGAAPRIHLRVRDYDRKVSAGPIQTQIAKFVTEADVLINLPILKSHWLSGITGALKNHLGTVSNARAFHRDDGQYIADLNALEPIKAKTRLCICDGLYGLYHGGPTYTPRYRWDFHGVIASLDPVALDATLADIIKTKRLEKGMPPYQKATVHIARAAELGLGCADLSKIERVEVGI